MLPENSKRGALPINRKLLVSHKSRNLILLSAACLNSTSTARQRSLNWVYCPRCDEVDVTIGMKGAHNLLDGGMHWVCVNPYCTAKYEPLLVTPTMLKIYTNRALGELWTHCEQAVVSAGNLTFIGYSLPDPDYLIRAMLIRGLAKNPRREDLSLRDLFQHPRLRAGHAED